MSSGVAMTQEERNELAALTQKEGDETINSTEQTRLQYLRDTFQCD
jgi:hypothetical protein